MTKYTISSRCDQRSYLHYSFQNTTLGTHFALCVRPPSLKKQKQNILVKKKRKKHM